MKRYWKIVIAIVLLLLLAGIVLAGTGLLTGASPNRIAELLFGGWEGLIAAVENQVESATGAANAVLPADAIGVTAVIG